MYVEKRVIKVFMLTVFLTVLLTLCGLMIGMDFLFLISTAIVFFILLITSTRIYETFSLFFFITTYFFFLMSSEFVQEVFGVINIREVTEEAKIHTNIVLILGLIFILLGYQLKISKSNYNFSKCYEKDDDVKKECVKRVSKYIFYISYAFYIIPTLEQVAYVALNSYAGYYVSYSSNLPPVISNIGDICPIAFSVFLACYPSRHESGIPFFLYLLYAVCVFLMGKRYLVIASIFFVITYCFIRNKTDESEGITWIKFRTLFLGICLLPVLCVGLYIYGFVRSGVHITGNNSFADMLLSFFNSVGQSDKVIKYGYMYENSIPQGHVYSFGGLIDYFKYNQISRLITGETISRGQTVEYALNGNSFSYMLTYVVFPNRYNAGYGLGSCFLAELYHDLSYFGVAVGSMFYGILLKNLFLIKRDKIWKNALMLYIYTTLLRAPRDSFDCFLQEIINLKFLVYFIFIFFLANHLYLKHWHYMKIRQKK